MRNLLLEKVRLVKEKDHGCVDKVLVVYNVVEKRQALQHPALQHTHKL
jgi:hypothetical protein